jgi:pteridine reductase
LQQKTSEKNKMTKEHPVALITGASQRIGAELTRTLHAAGFRVLIHYHASRDSAEALAAQLNQQRADSAACLQANLNVHDDVLQLAQNALAQWSRLDVLINNASRFYPTVTGAVDEATWNDLFAANLKAPFFLAQALKPALAAQKGSIINIVDINAQRPLPAHTVYCTAKAGLAMLTQTLALELAPEVRVNGVAPGAILWPENMADDDNGAEQRAMLAKIPLARRGDITDIARTALFLIKDAPYITGQIISVDGGRLLYS